MVNRVPSFPKIFPMDVTALLAKLYQQLPAENTGKVATYIPELAKVDPGKFGVHAVTCDQRAYAFGDSEECFSIQSIAKMLTLTMAYQREGDKLWERVDVEPSGTPFNSLVQLEADKGIPRNPLLREYP